MTDFLSHRPARLSASCAHGFERLITSLFDQPRIVPGHTLMAEVPVIGGYYLTDDLRHALP
jgi:hypothetical protein